MDKILLKSSAWLLTAQIITKITSFFYTIFLAKELGVANFGLYIVALSYYSLISSTADLGINRFLIREISKDTAKIHSLISPAICFRSVLMLVLLSIITVILFVLDPEISRRNLIFLALLATLPQGISLTLDSIFVSLLKIHYSAIGIVLLSIFTSISGVIFISFGLGALGAALALAVGQILYALSLLFITILIGIRWKGILSLGILKEMIKGSLPYGVLGVLGLLYFKIDVLLLSYLRGSFETGIYGAAYKFLEAVIFIPSTFAIALFPLLVRRFDTHIRLVENTYYNSLKILVSLAMIITLGYVLLLPLLIKFLLPQYQQSIEAIKILSLTIPFMFAHTPGVLVLLSTNKFLKTIVYISFGTLAFNIAVNLLLIPSLGYIGASIATVLSEILSFTIFYIFLKIQVFKK